MAAFDPPNTPPPSPPTYENTNPGIPRRTGPSSSSQPTSPPPRTKKPTFPRTRETVIPNLLSPATSAKPRFVMQHSEPGYNAWTSLRDIPRDVNISSLTVDGVARCIQLLGFEDKAQTFRKEDVDGRLLMALDESTLIRDFGFRGIEAKKVLLFAREGWQPNCD